MDLVGAYISVLRTLTGLSQPELAAKVGVSERTLRNLETGKHEPKPSDLAEILDQLHGSWVHVAQLLRPDATRAMAERFARDIQDGTGFTENFPELPEGISPEQLAQFVQQIVSGMLQSTVNESVDKAVASMIKSLPIGGFERVSINSRWAMEL